MEETNLPQALTALTNAISALVDPKPRTIDTGIALIPGLYTQLVDAKPGQKGVRTGVSQSQPPLWVDCIDLCNTIDQTVSQWQKRPNGTLGRLQAISKTKYRPQDVSLIQTMTTTIEGFTQSITELLDPKPRWTIAVPCPACNTKTVYRHQAGESIRGPALHVGSEGCICLACKTFWSPDKFVFLARLLGTIPKDVLN